MRFWDLSFFFHHFSLSPPLQHTTFFETRYSSLSLTGFHLLFHLRECCTRGELQRWTANWAFHPRQSFSDFSLSSEQAGIMRQQKDILPVFARRQPEEEIKSEANAERKRHGAAIPSTIRGKKDFALLAKLQFNSSSFIPSFRYSSHVMATSCDGANQELAMRHTLRAVNKRLMYRAFASLT